MKLLLSLVALLVLTATSQAQVRVERMTTTTYYTGPSIVYTVPVVQPNAVAIRPVIGPLGGFWGWRATPIVVVPAGPSQVEILQERIAELERKAKK